MGIMYKLLRHNKSIKMDLRKLKQNQNDMEEMVLRENDEVLQTNVEGEADTMQQEQQQFTAEHILQLCKFLAEKSKRNKNLQKYHESLNKSQLSMDYKNSAYEYVENNKSKIQVEDETTALLPHHNNCRLTTPIPASSESTPITASPVSSAATTTTNVLADKFVSTTNSCNNFNILSPSCFLQHSQNKRDILLKIRRQILERKRLRRLMHVQRDLTVWRPW